MTSDRALGYVVSRVIYQKYRCLGMSQSFCTAGRERDSIHESLLYKGLSLHAKALKSWKPLALRQAQGAADVGMTFPPLSGLPLYRLS